MIRAIITDFDGTLVDTFAANLQAYQRAFREEGLILSEEKYRECFGLRFEDFMKRAGIVDDAVAGSIRELKKEYYPQYFDSIKLNSSLLELITGFKHLGGKTAIASTARKENLLNVVNHFGIADSFNLIFAGDDVKCGKPDPEIYTQVMATLEVLPMETIIFEDSTIGIIAAESSGANCMIVSPEQFENNGNRSQRS